MGATVTAIAVSFVLMLVFVLAARVDAAVSFALALVFMWATWPIGREPKS